MFYNKRIIIERVKVLEQQGLNPLFLPGGSI
jgi:hypothetical protein